MGWMWIWAVLIVGGLLIIGFVVVRLVQGADRSSPTERLAESPAR
jgi:uncharacterized membrane-anchored protein YhcB (DUF1043 family)